MGGMTDRPAAPGGSPEIAEPEPGRDQESAPEAVAQADAVRAGEGGAPAGEAAPPAPGAGEASGTGESPAAAGPGADSGVTSWMRSLPRRLWAGGARPAAGSASARSGAPPGGWTQDGQPGPAPIIVTTQAPDEQVPRLLRQAAAWAWRLILVALLIYGAFRLSVALRLVVLPFIAALLLTALLQPLAARLHRAGFPAVAATWCTLLAAIIVIAGAVTLTANRVSADYPTLAAEVKRTAGQVQKSLAGPPFHLNSVRLSHLSNQLVQFLVQHKSVIAGTVLTGGRIFLEVLTGLVLTLFITFFLIKDGSKIWGWLISGLSPEAHRRMTNAGHASWHALTGYVRGTTAVAAIHAIFIGLALWLLGVPLLAPLIILVFLAAFIPLIGILVVGALAILITLGTRGWIAAVILLAVFLVENQIESHLLQPLVIGRAVRLHPLGIILALAVGGVIAGIPGAIVAVPVAAVVTYAWPLLRGGQPAPQHRHPAPRDGPPRDGPGSAPEA